MQQSTNTFNKGMVSDFHPLSLPKEAYTDALNATLITYNGNENLLQNDMGNTLIQDAKSGNIMGLRSGFVPVGMKEHGGVMYIASVNKDGEGELGTIPSPVIRYDKGQECVLPVSTDNSVYKVIDSTVIDQLAKILSKESSLFRLTDFKLSTGEKFVTALKLGSDQQTPIEIDRSYIKSSNPEKYIFKYPYFTKVEKDSNLFSNIGLYKINLYAETDSLKLKLEEITKQQHTYYTKSKGLVKSQYWFLDLNSSVNDVDFDTDTMLINDLSDDLNKQKSFICYPNFPDGYPAITIEKEDAPVDFLLAINYNVFKDSNNNDLNSFHVHPLTYFDNNPQSKTYRHYFAIFSEFWYKTNSAVHADKLNIYIVDDSTGDKIDFIFANSGKTTKQGTLGVKSSNDELVGYYYDDSEDLFKIINKNNSTSEKYCSGDSSKNIALFSVDNRNKSLFYVDLGPSINSWYTLHVLYYSDEWDYPVGEYTLRFNLAVLDGEFDYRTSELKPELNYIGKQIPDGYIQLYYNITKVYDNNITITSQTNGTETVPTANTVTFGSFKVESKITDQLSLEPQYEECEYKWCGNINNLIFKEDPNNPIKKEKPSDYLYNFSTGPLFFLDPTVNIGIALSKTTSVQTVKYSLYKGNSATNSDECDAGKLNAFENTVGNLFIGTSTQPSAIPTMSAGITCDFYDGNHNFLTSETITIGSKYTLTSGTSYKLIAEENKEPCGKITFNQTSGTAAYAIIEVCPDACLETALDRFYYGEVETKFDVKKTEIKYFLLYISSITFLSSADLNSRGCYNFSKPDEDNWDRNSTIVYNNDGKKEIWLKEDTTYCYDLATSLNNAGLNILYTYSSVGRTTLPNKAEYNIIPQFNLFGSPYKSTINSSNYGLTYDGTLYKAVESNLYWDTNYLLTQFKESDDLTYIFGSEIPIGNKYVGGGNPKTSLDVQLLHVYQFDTQLGNVYKLSEINRALPQGLYYLNFNMPSIPYLSAEGLKRNSYSIVLIVLDLITGKDYTLDIYSQESILVLPNAAMIKSIEVPLYGGRVVYFDSAGLYKVNLELDGSEASNNASVFYNRFQDIECFPYNSLIGSVLVQNQYETNSFIAIPQACWTYAENGDASSLSKCIEYNYLITRAAYHGYLRRCNTYAYTVDGEILKQISELSNTSCINSKVEYRKHI